MTAPPEELESLLGYRFQNRDLLLRALTHKSLRSESAAPIRHNELLEFLGDSILGFLASEFVFRLAPGARECLLDLARRMLAELHAHPELQTLRRWCLATRDAHGVYRPMGYAPVAPERWMERVMPRKAWAAD